MAKKVMNRRAMAPSVAAEAAAYSSKTGGLGEGDLLAALDSGSVDLEELDDDSFDSALRPMSKEERKAYIGEKQEKRKAAKAKLKKLSKQRADWIKKNAKPKKDSMDARMMGSVKAQAEAYGMTWK
jgi:hypothetical protein